MKVARQQTGTQPRTSGRMRAALRRCWWGSLCLIHIAPLISTTAALGDTGGIASHGLSAALVWLTFAFFALKFVDVGWLRWRASRSSVLAFVIACGVAHHDVSAMQGAQAFFAEAPAALAGSLLWELAARSHRALRDFLSTLHSHLRWNARLWFVASDASLIALAPLLCRQSLAAIAIPRAPPAAH